jgi:hypothetical protein
MAVLGHSGSVLGITAFGLLLGCTSGNATGPNAPGPVTGGGSGSEGSPGTGGRGGSAEVDASTTGGTTGSGGSSTTGGSGGAAEADASNPGSGGAGGATADAGSTAGPGVETPPGSIDYGGVGQQPLIPLAYTAQPVPPIVAMDCPDEPTAGYTEYKDSFVVQRPRNLAAKNRFKYENGIYTVWIQRNDQPHKPNNTTNPRTETRFSDLGTGEHIMSFDVMVEPGSDGTVVHQFKSAGTQGGNIGTYLEVNGGTMKDRAGTVASNILGKWLNIKVAFNIATGAGRIWLNNCLKVTTQKEKNALWYFKFGTYHCDNADVCRANFKNIHLYQKGSTDKFNVKSPIP